MRLGESRRHGLNISNPRFIFLTLRPQRQYQISQNIPFFFAILIFLFPYSNKSPRKISLETTGNSVPLEITPMLKCKQTQALAISLLATDT